MQILEHLVLHYLLVYYQKQVKPTFEINDDEIEIGMGIHGEPGIKREKLKPANELVDDFIKE